jgi:hypothetical protein
MSNQHKLLVGNWNPNFDEWEDVREATPTEIRESINPNIEAAAKVLRYHIGGSISEDIDWLAVTDMAIAEALIPGDTQPKAVTRREREDDTYWLDTPGDTQ